MEDGEQHMKLGGRLGTTVWDQETRFRLLNKEEINKEAL